MADLTTTADVDTLMGSANFAAFRSSLSLTTIATTSPGTGVTTALAIAVGSAGAFVTFNGALGTPSSGTLTSCTGLPVSTGISGLGTGVATALAVNTGSSGAFVVLNGALGTPSSGTLTNCTGLPTAGLVDDSVTLAKIQNAAANSKLLGSGAAGSGANYVEITLGTNLSMSGTTLNATGGGGGIAGPGTTTNTAIVLWNSTDGTVVQDSTVLIDPVTGDMTGVGDITGDSVAVTTLSIGGTAITATGAQINASAGAFTPASASGAASIALAEDTDNGSNTVSIAAPASVASNKTATLQDVTGTIYVTGGTDVAVADGGTGLSSGTSGGILGFTASGTIASSAALAANAIVIGGGAGATPTTTTTGTGVLTALGVNVGSAGALVTNGGALGTPSSGTLTNCTGLPASSLTAGTLAANITLGELAGNIVLDGSLSADGTCSGILIVGTSGYTQAFGDVVYLDPTDSRWEACDANAASGADGDSRGLVGMVAVAGTDGNTCTILLRGTIRADVNFPTFTVNNPIYISETAGDVTQTQPTTTDAVIRIIGAALTADSMYFSPDNTWITHT